MGSDVRDDKDVSPGEAGAVPALASEPIPDRAREKQERRFLLKLDLYLITWAWCAYLIKVSPLLIPAEGSKSIRATTKPPMPLA
jgi:hypothetical protein